MFGEQPGSKRIRNPKEERVIELVAEGLTNCEVAKELGTTEYVVKNHLRTIYDKLGLWNRVELALWYEARRQENLVAAEALGRVSCRESTAARASEIN
jgi:DNA-binding NarL/FixJ family response regulator